MPQVKESAANFLDAVAHALNVSWLPGSVESADLQWRSCALTVDAACRFYAGATSDVWEELRHDGDSGFAVLVEAIESAAAERFGSEVRCTGIESCDAPPEDWAATVWDAPAGPMEVVMSSEALDALGGGSPVARVENALENSMDMLLHVEIPVSVSLGRTRLRMKDLLGLGHGSVVELDQELGDQVEIRVNNCVIARGEVVAVDGNYGVRILSLVKGGSLVKNGGVMANGQAGRGLPENEAV
jgi:flagellar motor switch protein FliN